MVRGVACVMTWPMRKSSKKLPPPVLDAVLDAILDAGLDIVWDMALLVLDRGPSRSCVGGAGDRRTDGCDRKRLSSSGRAQSQQKPGQRTKRAKTDNARHV